MTFFLRGIIPLICFVLQFNFLIGEESKLLWSPEAILSTKLIVEVQVAPDHESALYIASDIHTTEHKKKHYTRLYRTTLGENPQSIPMTEEGLSVSQPRWSPDGLWIAYIANIKGIRQLCVTSNSTGTTRILTDGDNGIQTFEWSHNSQSIAFVMQDLKSTPQSPYVYPIEPKVNRLWVIDCFMETPFPRALTGDEFCVRGLGDFGLTTIDFDWSPDDSAITFSYSPSLSYDDYHLKSSIATVRLSDGHIEKWLPRCRFESTPRYSPDGSMIAYIEDDTKEEYAYNRRLAIKVKDGEQKSLAKTSNEGALIGSNHLIGWSKEGSEILLVEPKGTKRELVFVSVDGKTTRSLNIGSSFVSNPYLSRDLSYLGFVMQTPGTPPEAYISPIEPFNPVQSSHLNEKFKAFPSLLTESISWESTDGLQIEGLLTYPLHYQKEKQYPLLLVIHGGPMAFFDETFIGSYYPYPLASFAEAGYFILRPNPRGSTGYGKDFRCLNYSDWGGKDYDDIMSGVDRLIESGLIDSERMGVMGWSYGGYLTGWTMGQTSRFKAASAGAGIFNLTSSSGTLDIPRLITDYMGNYPENSDLYENRSPLRYTTNVSTPCLIQHGMEDLRVPVSQAYEFYHALKRANKTVELHLYKGMTHRFTDYDMQFDLMQQNLDWFCYYLNPVKSFSRAKSQTESKR